MTIRVIGLDLAKNVFQVHGVDEAGRVTLKRKLHRAEVLRLFADLPPPLSAWRRVTPRISGREIAALGHDVRLICRVCTDHFTRARVESTA
jgi:transposase